jgi:hypothetical protein
LPSEVRGLVACAGHRIRLETLGVQQLDRGAASFHVRFGPQPGVPAERLVELVHATPGSALSPEGVLRWPLASQADPISGLGEVLDTLEGASPIMGQ